MILPAAKVLVLTRGRVVDSEILESGGGSWIMLIDLGNREAEWVSGIRKGPTLLKQLLCAVPSAHLTPCGLAAR